MKKIFILIGFCSLVAFYACDDRGDIRKDIDELNARLDNLDERISALNKEIANYQNLYEGLIFIEGYSRDTDGNYILSLSNGEKLTVYSGRTSDELPEMSIGEDGCWYYTTGGKTIPLLDSAGQKVSASPSAGKGLQVRVNDSGYWEYSADGVNWQGGIGMAEPSKGGISVSIFTKVEMTEKGLSLTWKDAEGTDQTTIVTSADDFSLALENEQNLSFTPGETKTLGLVQTNVAEIVIEPTDWGVRVGEHNVILTAPAKNKQEHPYKETIVLKYFSTNGQAKVLTIPVELLND